MIPPVFETSMKKEDVARWYGERMAHGGLQWYSKLSRTKKGLQALLEGLHIGDAAPLSTLISEREMRISVCLEKRFG